MGDWETPSLTAFSAPLTMAGESDPIQASSTPSAVPSYNSAPYHLLFYDINLFFTFFRSLPEVFLPLAPALSGPLDELYPSGENLWCIFLHLLYTTIQIGFLVSLFFCVFPTVGFVIVYVSGFLLLNYTLCKFTLNGRARFITSDVNMSPFPRHDNERWIFINGISVGCVTLRLDVPSPC